MIRTSLVPSLCFAALLCAACATHPKGVESLPSETFYGHVTASTSGTWFTACSSAADSDRMWVTFTGASIQQAERAKSSGLLADGQKTYVRVNAARTDERHAGPGGPALLVSQIHEIRGAQADDCAAK